jgi:cytoskeleton protein RodZ
MGPRMTSVERSDVDFGTRMRRTREARGISLRNIADTTKLSMRALEALERNDISILPGGIFSRAFVRSYALEIGVDPEQAVREFITQFPHDSVTIGSPHVLPDLDVEAKGRRRRLGMMAMAVVLMLLMAAVVLYFIRFR